MWRKLDAHGYILCHVCFSSARIWYIGPARNESGPTFSPALFYVSERPERFEMAFAGIGVVPKNQDIGTSHSRLFNLL